jgi:hypothetical protein
MAYGAYVAALHIVPGPWVRWSKGQVVDAWTVTHLAWSVIAKRMGVPLPTLMALAAGNEAVEWVTRLTRPDLTFGSPESVTNVAADLAANYLGYVITPG